MQVDLKKTTFQISLGHQRNVPPSRLTPSEREREGNVLPLVFVN